jgi:hypothetical protein
MMNSGRCLIGLVALLSFFPAGGQAIDGLCACAPGTYRFTFNFTSSCTEKDGIGGIATTFCDVEGFGESAENVTDFVPVSGEMFTIGFSLPLEILRAHVYFLFLKVTVDFVTVVELGQDSVGVAQQNYSQSFADGDFFDYVSIVGNDNSTFPKAIQLVLYAQNAGGNEIVNILAVSFTNDCSVYPVLDEGFSLGWADFVSLVRHDTIFL